MAERIAVIDYGAGNIRSVVKAIERAASDLGREVQLMATGSADAVAGADRIVLPGVGAFGQCATALRAVPGLEETLVRRVIEEGAPFLGICVGMQLLARRGEEHGTHRGLGWIPGDVVRIAPHDPMMKVPHMGWGRVSLRMPGLAHPALKHIEDGGQAYFVHSFHLQPSEHAHLLGATDYGGQITAIVGRDNILGTQFHPEKSQDYGLAFLRAFLDWTP